MRVIKIDPKSSSVTFYILPDKKGKVDNKDIYAAINCKYMQFIMVAPHVLLIIDEEGLRKHNHHWAFDNMQNFAGSGLLCGYDPDTEDILAVPDFVTEGDVLQHIFWLGNDQGLERNIKRGIIMRPKQELIAGNERQILWEWQPHEPTEDQPDYNR